MTPARHLQRLSDALASVERILLMALIAAVAGLVLMNVSFRAFGITLAWADELAILAMTLAAFVGASLMLRARSAPAVQILHEVTGPGVLRGLRVAVSALSVACGAGLAWLVWRWFDLPDLFAVGFDVATFETVHLNFLYTEATPVMGLPFWWFYLIMPWFAISLLVHALTNLLEDLGLIVARKQDADPNAGEG
jgi:TRAP-type C4-dicarboxylate transport system permease small subunit